MLLVQKGTEKRITAVYKYGHVTRVLLADIHYIRYIPYSHPNCCFCSPASLFEYRLTARQWLPVPRFHCTRTVLAASFNKLRLTSPNFRLETPRSRFLGLALETRIVCPVDYSAVALMPGFNTRVGSIDSFGATWNYCRPSWRRLVRARA